MTSKGRNVLCRRLCHAGCPCSGEFILAGLDGHASVPLQTCFPFSPFHISHFLLHCQSIFTAPRDTLHTREDDESGHHRDLLLVFFSSDLQFEEQDSKSKRDFFIIVLNAEHCTFRIVLNKIRPQMDQRAHRTDGIPISIALDLLRLI